MGEDREVRGIHQPLPQEGEGGPGRHHRGRYLRVERLKGREANSSPSFFSLIKKKVRAPFVGPKSKKFPKGLPVREFGGVLV